ncbi:MAG: hypothetical protein ABIJ45_07195 [Candidatus Zixiibacteriota bacterium]
MKTLLAVLIILVWPIGAIGGNNGIAVNMNIRQCSWADINLSDRLDMYLSTVDNIPIRTHEQIYSSFNNAYHTSTFGELLATGKENGDNFVVDVVIDKIDLERRKVTIFPHVIFRYRVYAIVSGTIRIIDVNHERLLKMKNIELEFKTKDRWQVVDDNQDEPELHISADNKLVIMNELEDLLATELYNEIKQLARGVAIESEG